MFVGHNAVWNFMQKYIFKLSDVNFDDLSYLFLTFTFYKNLFMSNMLPFLFLFIIALAIGVFIGKLIFSARFHSEKFSLE